MIFIEILKIDNHEFIFGLRLVIYIKIFNNNLYTLEL